MTDGRNWEGRPYAPEHGTLLGSLDDIADGACREYSFGLGIHAFRMFVIRRGTLAAAYLNLCPHYSLPLNHRDGEFLTRDGNRIMCRQHLALFDIDTGQCLDGACEGQGLIAIPVTVSGDATMTVG